MTRLRKLFCRSLASTLFAAALVTLHPAPALANFGPHGPFFMSTAGSSEVQPVLDHFFRTTDYVSKSAAQNDPVLGARIPEKRTYTLPPSLERVQNDVDAGCDGDNLPGLIIYNPEPWDATPPEEQDDPVAAIHQGADIAHAAGCDYGTAPSSRYLFGSEPGCTYDLSQGIYTQVDWTKVELLDIQAQTLISDSCWDGGGGKQKYVDIITEVANYAHSVNPNIQIAAQVSFRLTPPDRMTEAIEAVASVADGVYFAYPVQLSDCTYCTPENWETVLKAFRGIPFFPHRVFVGDVRHMAIDSPTDTTPHLLPLDTVGRVYRWATADTFPGGTVIPPGIFTWNFYSDGSSDLSATLRLEFGYCTNNDSCFESERVPIIPQSAWARNVPSNAYGQRASHTTTKPWTLPSGGPYRLYFLIKVETAPTTTFNILYDALAYPSVFSNTLQ
ncbi:MAG: hypothetical protein GEU78_14325 [Actinobacteria bacterium]|nr:hypothetical protein [Actinomycetota bacterium]